MLMGVITFERAMQSLIENVAYTKTHRTKRVYR